MGGVLMIIGGVLEWVLGNSFASVVFFTFGGFWLSLGGTLVPSFAAYSSFAIPGQAAQTGIASQGFNAGIGTALCGINATSLRTRLMRG